MSNKVVAAKPKQRSTRRMRVVFRRAFRCRDILRRRGALLQQSVAFPLAAMPISYIHSMIRMYEEVKHSLPEDFDDNPGQVSTDGGETWEKSGLTRAYLVAHYESALRGLRGELQRRKRGHNE